MIKTARRSKNGFLFDALDDPETMIRVNDLVADFECHESPCQEAQYGRPKSYRQFIQYSSLSSAIQREQAVKPGFFRLSPARRIRLKRSAWAEVNGKRTLLMR